MLVIQGEVISVVKIRYNEREWKEVAVLFIDGKGNKTAGFGTVSADYKVDVGDTVFIHNRNEKHKIDILEIL